MKIALFHTEEISTLYQLEAAARHVGFLPYLFHLKDLRLKVGSDAPVVCSAGGVDLREMSLIFVRGFWHYEKEVTFLAQFCRMHRIPLLDTALIENQVISKLSDIEKFAATGLPVPKTIYIESIHEIQALERELGFPIIAKEDRSRRGRNVLMIKTHAELVAFVEKNCSTTGPSTADRYHFQEFIPADFDVRVLVLGEKVLGAIERRSNDPNEFRHNIALGGHASTTTISQEIQTMALTAARTLDYQFAGVDFITHRGTGQIYILEANRSPGFTGFMKATGRDVPLEVMRFFLRFMQKHLQ